MRYFLVSIYIFIKIQGIKKTQMRITLTIDVEYKYICLYI